MLKSYRSPHESPTGTGGVTLTVVQLKEENKKLRELNKKMKEELIALKNKLKNASTLL